MIYSLGHKRQPSPVPHSHLIPLRHDHPRQSYYQATARTSEYQQTAGELQVQYEREGFRMITTPDYGVGYQGGGCSHDVIDESSVEATLIQTVMDLCLLRCVLP